MLLALVEEPNSPQEQTTSATLTEAAEAEAVEKGDAVDAVAEAAKGEAPAPRALRPTPLRIANLNRRGL